MSADVIGRPSVILRERREDILRLLMDAGCTQPRVFGSVARGEDSPQSDIDLLVRPDYSRPLAFITLPRRLSEMLGIKVDVISDRAKGRLMPGIVESALPL